MTKDDTTKDHAKAAALTLLERGLVSQAEAARLAGVSRQLLRHWAKDIDSDEARDAHLAKIWAKQIAKAPR